MGEGNTSACDMGTTVAMTLILLLLISISTVGKTGGCEAATREDRRVGLRLARRGGEILLSIPSSFI